MRLRFTCLILSLVGVLGSFSAQGQQQLVYGRGATASGPMDLLADVYTPRGVCLSPRPTAVYAHGGGFRNGSRQNSKARLMAAAYTAAGFNFVSISYRLAGDQPVIGPAFQPLVTAGIARGEEKYPGQGQAAAAAMEDMITALWALHRNASALCVDGESLVLIGSSAGAVMALNVGYSMDDWGIAAPPVAAVVDLWGAALLPENIAARDVPLFIVHGERDQTTPFDAAEDYWARALATGTPVHLHAFQNARHGVGLRERVGGQRLVDLMVAFSQDAVVGRTIQSRRTRN